MASIDEDVFAKLLKDKTMEKVLAYIVESKSVSVHYDLEHGYHYPRIEAEADLTPDESIDLLSKLASLRILSENILFLSIACPRCGSTNVAIVYRCPKCSSIMIRRDLLMEHIPCGYIGLESSFKEKGEGSAVCPRCGASISGDVRIAGVWFSCLSCNSRFPEPGHNIFCRVCREFFTVKDASLEFVVEYYVGDEAYSILKKLIFPSRIRAVIEGSGFDIEENVSIKGRSGVVHLIDFIARRGQGKPIAFLIENTLKPITEAKVIEWYTKSMDTGMEIVYVTPAPIPDGARKLIQFYGLTVIEAVDSADAEVKVRSIIESIR